MKVIDLYNKIANGEEVPEKIIYRGYSYRYYKGIYDYKNENNYNEDYLFDRIDSGLKLNDEIEIIADTQKQDQKLEKIDISKFPKRNNSLKKTALKVNEIIELLNNSVLLSEKDVSNFIDKVNGK